MPATVVVAVVFFGRLLLRSGGAEFFNDIAMATMGRRRGGPAMISIVASALFGSLSRVICPKSSRRASSRSG